MYSSRKTIKILLYKEAYLEFWEVDPKQNFKEIKKLFDPKLQSILQIIWGKTQDRGDTKLTFIFDPFL